MKCSRSEGSLVSVWRVDQEEHAQPLGQGALDSAGTARLRRLALFPPTVQFLMLRYATEL